MLPTPFDLLKESQLNYSSHQPGEAVFLQDNKTIGMFYIVRGEIVLQRHTKNGEQVVIHQAFGGETFAEASLFSEVYHCDAIARSDCEIVLLEKNAVKNLFKTNLSFATALTTRFAMQVQTYRRRLELLAIRNAKERTYTALVDGLLNGSVKEFASEIGLTHEAAYRALADLVNEGRATKIGRGKYQSP